MNAITIELTDEQVAALDRAAADRNGLDDSNFTGLDIATDAAKLVINNIVKSYPEDRE